MPAKRKGAKISGVGMPAAMKLEEFGSQVWHAFGEPPYLVGSATRSKKWRDIDVRLILSDEIYKEMKLGDPKDPYRCGKWVALCWAFSELGRSMTGLPIDFQIQQRTYASEKYKGWRSVIGLVALRFSPKE